MSVIVEKNVAVQMSDGVTLKADIYRPHDNNAHPVLLQRTPYNKELWPITALTLDPLRAAEAGYAVVIQDVRGRWASEGDVFFPYRDEASDGADSITWAAEQDFSSGWIGCYGLSYMGGTSWLAAMSGHPALGAISPTTAPNDFHRNHFWRGGALNIGTLAMWALRAIGPSALIRSRPEPSSFYPLLIDLFDHVDGFAETLSTLPLDALAAALPDDENFVPFFFEFLRHPTPDAWTESLLLSNHHERVKVPSLSIAGWHDLLLAADLEHFSGMRANAGNELARQQSKLIVGPWAHGMFQHVVGDVDFGFRANGMFLDLKEDLTRLQLRWFDRWLKNIKNGIDDEAPVRLFVQGVNRWRDEDEWPPRRAEMQQWHLSSGAGLRQGAAEQSTEADAYVYDPNDPCPTIGGNVLLPPQYVHGPAHQDKILERRDVLVYTSQPLTRDTEVTGQVAAILHASTSGRDTDWMIKLCVVDTNGRTTNVCDGVLRASMRDGVTRQSVTPGEIVSYEIDLWSTAMVFRAGHRLRVIISSSDFPRYDRNPNTGELSHEATRMEPALQKIYHDREHPSYLMLPVID